MTATINPARTVAEILLENPSRAAVFERHRIDYCCNGRRTLQEACLRRGIDVESVVGDLAPIGESQDQVPLCAGCQEMSCADLVAHILSVHHAFLRRELPRLMTLAEKVARVHGDHAPQCIAIRDVFSGLRDELELHMQKEEEILFPFVVKLEEGIDSPFPTVARPISCMEHEHADAGVALDRLRELTSGYEPPMDACNSWRVLYHGLGELERDLHQHIHEENNILFPRALALESAVRGTGATRYTG